MIKRIKNVFDWLWDEGYPVLVILIVVSILLAIAIGVS